MPRLVYRTELEATPEEVYDWHMRPGALERLMPPFEPGRVLFKEGPLEEGALRVLELGPLRSRWRAVHDSFVPGRQFRDVQQSGPMARWEHTHRFLPSPDGRTVLEDDIEYALPWPLEPLVGWYFRRLTNLVFAYRHRRTRQDLLRPRRPAKTVAVTGASGLIGTQLAAFLSTAGHTVVPVVRRGERPGEVSVERLEGLDGVDAVVHLAGKNVAESLWSPDAKRAILESRTLLTHRLCRALAELPKPPAVLVCASATGFYGDRGDLWLDELSQPGSGFLSEVCQAWEAATRPARKAGIRVVHLRIGGVFSGRGGLLPRMAWPFRLGLGAVVGSGSQWLSWISHEDVVAAIDHCLWTESLEGAVNAVAPEPTTMREFAHTLGRVLRRPVWFRVPLTLVEMALGDMAEIIRVSQRVRPVRLLESGFRFEDPDLELALRHQLGV